ncbi:MAG: hypothetical protein ABSF22_26905 [Bryobacteraceae bacterium]
MSKIYIIEVHELGAGLVVQEAAGFRFFSADPTFSSLDGCLFRSPSEAEKVATRIGSAGPKPSTASNRSAAPEPAQSGSPSRHFDGERHVEH